MLIDVGQASPPLSSRVLLLNGKNSNSSNSFIVGSITYLRKMGEVLFTLHTTQVRVYVPISIMGVIMMKLPKLGST